MALAKVKQKGQVTIPFRIRQDLGIGEGDYLEVTAVKNRIVLVPKDITDRHPVIDAALAEALDDERAGRVSPKFASVKEYQAWLKTKEGKRFVRPR